MLFRKMGKKMCWSRKIGMSASRCFVWSLTRRFLNEWTDKIYVEYKKSAAGFVNRINLLQENISYIRNTFILNYLS